MSLLRYILSGLVISLAGCNTTTVNQPTSSSQSNAKTETSLLQAKLSPLFTGTIHKKDGAAATFTSCGSQQSFELEADDSFWQQWRNMGSPEEFQASLSGQLAMGTNRGDSFRLQVIQPSRLVSDMSLCQSTGQSYQIKAGSDQPFWALVIDNDQAAITTPSGVESYQVTSVTTPSDQDFQLALQTQDGKKASLQLTNAFCQEPNQNGFSGYQASLQLDDGQTLTGCGEQGNSLSQQQPAQTWKGRSELEKSDITLTLLPNFNAKMVYKRDIGPEVTYDGVWLVSKDQSLRVMFNKRMGLDTSEAIPFVWKDKTLTAEYRELSAGKAYFMQPMVLTASETAPSPVTADMTATTNGAVMVAAPVADNTLGNNSFAENETVLTGASAATPTNTGDSQQPAMASFSAGSLQASVQTDAAVESAVRNALSADGADISGLQYRYAKADLNGDGQLDAIVQLNQCDQIGCNWLVLQGDSGQYQTVGQLTGFSHAVFVSPSAHNGWYDLLTPSNQQAGSYDLIMHDNASYAQRPTALEAAPDESALLQLQFTGENWITLQ